MTKELHIQVAGENSNSLKIELDLKMDEFNLDEISQMVHDLKNQAGFLSDFCKILKNGYKLDDDRAGRFITRFEQAVALIKPEIHHVCKISKAIAQQASSNSKDTNHQNRR
jgi:hypothetical protein